MLSNARFGNERLFKLSVLVENRREEEKIEDGGNSDEIVGHLLVLLDFFDDFSEHTKFKPVDMSIGKAVGVTIFDKGQIRATNANVRDERRVGRVKSVSV